MTEAEKAAQEAAEAASIAKFSQAGNLTPEQIAAQEAAAAQAGVGVTAKTPDQIAAEEAAAAAVGANDKFTPNKYWDYLKEDGIDMPEVLGTEKLDDSIDENKLIFQAVQQKVLNSLPPSVKELYTYMNENDNAEEFYKAKAGESGYLGLPDEQFAKEYMRRADGKSDANPTGLSDEAIDERVQKLVTDGNLDLFVMDWRKNAKKDVEESKSDINVQAAADKRHNDAIEGAKTNMQTFYNSSLKEVTKINGLDVTSEQLDSFKPLFEKIVLPDKALGTSPLMMMIQDNGVLFNMLFGLFNSEGAINNILSNTKEEAKKGILKMLDIEPVTVRKVEDETSERVVLSKFASAEQK